MFYTSLHEDSKQITKRIMNTSVLFSERNRINDTDRTVIGLLWHENIIDLLQKLPKHQSILLYVKLLKEIIMFIISKYLVLKMKNLVVVLLVKILLNIIKNYLV